MTDQTAELTLQLNQIAWMRVGRLLRACLDITPRAGFRPITLHATVCDHAATITCHTCNGPAAVRARTTIQNAGADGNATAHIRPDAVRAWLRHMRGPATLTIEDWGASVTAEDTTITAAATEIGLAWADLASKPAADGEARCAYTPETMAGVYRALSRARVPAVQVIGADGAPTRLWAASDTMRVDALIMPIRFPLHEEDTK